MPPALEHIALAIVNNDRLDDGKANPYKGTAEVVVDARLTSDTAWFLLDTTKAVKPFIYQERKAPVFVQQTGEESDDVFNRKEYKLVQSARRRGIRILANVRGLHRRGLIWADGTSWK